MTGSGTATANGAAGRVDAEARSVNHRFLKTSIHLDGALSALEPAVEEHLRARVERGHVTVSLRFTRSSKSRAAAVRVDDEVARAAAKKLTALVKRAGLAGPVTLRDLLAVPGVLGDDRRDETPPAVQKLALDALDGAVAALVAARAKEGAHLADECRSILARIAAARDRIAVRAPTLPGAYRDRLTARIATLLEGTGVAPDPAALAREVASFADRCDVAEELARLTAHVRHVEDVLAAGGAVGRRLDFLVQELHREANTIGSKSPDAETTSTVVEMKADVERLREQVQNFE
jgi:uncharacterized protein (TIGR00255 family)